MNTNTNTFAFYGESMEIARINGGNGLGARDWADASFETNFPSSNDFAPALRHRFELLGGVLEQGLPKGGEVMAMQNWFRHNWQKDFDLTMVEEPRDMGRPFQWRRTSRGWAGLCESGWELMTGQAATSSPQI